MFDAPLSVETYDVIDTLRSHYATKYGQGSAPLVIFDQTISAYFDNEDWEGLDNFLQQQWDNAE